MDEDYITPENAETPIKNVGQLKSYEVRGEPYTCATSTKLFVIDVVFFHILVSRHTYIERYLPMQFLGPAEKGT